LLGQSLDLVAFQETYIQLYHKSDDFQVSNLVISGLDLSQDRYRNTQLVCQCSPSKAQNQLFLGTPHYLPVRFPASNLDTKSYFGGDA